MITKFVEGNKEDNELYFDFVIELSDENFNATYGDVIFENGKAEFSLKANESITFDKIPAGITYKVQEVNVEGFEVTVKNGEGEITKDTVIEVEFLNKRPKKPTPPDDYKVPNTANRESRNMILLGLLGLSGIIGALKERDD